jgi:hypothetical protein
MYHPAAALYNPNLRNTIKKDFKKLKKFVDNGCKLEEKEEEQDQQLSFTKEKQDAVNEILDL